MSFNMNDLSNNMNQECLDIEELHDQVIKSI